MSTPMKTPRHSRTKSSDSCKYSENFQPNIPIFTPSKKSTPSKKIASRSATKPRNPAVLSPPPPPLRRERKFVIAKKNNSTKQANDLEAKKRQEAAYEKLRASQEEFFKKDIVPVLKSEASKNGEEKEELQKNESLETKTKSMVMEEAMKSIPEPGSGRVKHIVKAFESLLSISDGEESGKKERKNILMDWLMPNLPPKVEQSNGCECPSSLGPSSVELFPVRGHEMEPSLLSFHSIVFNGVESPESTRASWLAGSRGSGFIAGSTSPSSTARVRVRAVLRHYPREIVSPKLMGAESSFRVGPDRPSGDKKGIRIGLGFTVTHWNEFHSFSFKFTSSASRKLAITAAG